MITCTPLGICSWKFDLRGDGHRARVAFAMAGESGSITTDGETFEVRKQGFMSGEWNLERSREVVASARKCSAFTRSFELEGPMGAVLLRAESAFTRSYLIERDEDPLAVIRPAHAFTRRATIELRADSYDWPTICLAFWLTVLMRRRAARRNS